ncbi:MAG: Hpt domain-containing protein [Pseudomonadota bacterium]
MNDMNSNNKPLDEEKSQSTPIDVEHLDKLTMGDVSVKEEVLKLFCEHSDSYIERLRSSQSAKDWREAAHSLKGSARGIGAWHVATQAEKLEALNECDVARDRDRIIADLRDSIENVKSYIQKHS